MVVHIARVAERAMRERRAVPLGGQPPKGDDVAFTGVALVDRDAEVFSAPEAIAAEMTPEMLAKCRDLRLTVHSGDLSAQVRFHCRPPQRGRVRMSVSGSPASDPDEIVEGKTRLQRGITRSLLGFGGLAITALLQLILAG